MSRLLGETLGYVPYLQVIPGHSVFGIAGNLLGLPLQFHQVVERSEEPIVSDNNDFSSSPMRFLFS